MARYSKPYLTIDQQIELLRRRGMSISDEVRAARYLQHIGYYRLSAYWYPCRKVVHDHIGRSNDFVGSPKFYNVVDLYVFDKRLRLLLLDAIERIEVSLRTTIALELGKIGPEAYLDERIYRSQFLTAGTKPDSDFGVWRKKFEQQKKRSKEDFVTHFLSKYPGSELPIWIAVELWDFGMLSRLLSGLESRHIRAISDAYKVCDTTSLPAWIRSINIVRNICAYHGRLWNRVIADAVKRPKKIDSKVLEHFQSVDLDRSRIYLASAVMQFLLQSISPDSTWRDRFLGLMQTFPENEHFHIQDAGFPDDWVNLPLWSDA